MTVSNIDSSILNSLVNSYVETATETENDAKLMMDDFLTIFLTQLQYQDPLNPMEGTDMTAQVAQITMVEQQYNTTEALSTISDQLAAQQSNQLLGYIGKAVMIDGSAMTLKSNELIGGNYTLTENASVEIVIYDQDGKEINTLSSGNLDAGEYKVEWNGMDYDGNLLDDGLYYYEITATNNSGDNIEAQTTWSGIVTGISYENDQPHLITNGGTISLDSVIRVYEAG